METAIQASPEWEEALSRAAGCRRTLVLGPPDVGKSSFIRALARLRPETALIDLDPGQKMVGPPGSLSLGRLAPELRLDRFVFVGSTAVGSFRQLGEAAIGLRASAGANPVAINTSGYVTGPGARLQLMTVAALRPELIVAIGIRGTLAASLEGRPGLVSLEPSPQAQRKPPGLRRRIRQAALDAALAGATEQWLDRTSLRFSPDAPATQNGEARPVCSLADAAGEDMEIGLLLAAGPDRMRILARQTVRPPALVRLGKMWVRPDGNSIALLDRLAPSWTSDGS